MPLSPPQNVGQQAPFGGRVVWVVFVGGVEKYNL